MEEASLMGRRGTFASRFQGRKEEGLRLYILFVLFASAVAIHGATQPMCTVEIDGLLGWVLDFLQKKSNEVEKQLYVDGPVHEQWISQFTPSLTATQGNKLTFSLVGLGLEITSKKCWRAPNIL